MRVGRVGRVGSERVVVLDADGQLLDASSVVPRLDPEALANGALDVIRGAVASGTLAVFESDGFRFGSPVARPGKVVCVGLNYRAHAEETGAPIPDEPIVFMKDPYTVVGPNDQVLVPRASVKTDYEVELAVVIGRTARYVQTYEDALSCVAGYAVSHDVSEREFQLERGSQWDKGKSCETFNPLGPWLVTPDEVPDPQNLSLRLTVNGQPRQQGHTSDMIFGVAELIRYLSQMMVLYPGDIINTGTPAGVALGHPDPKPYLRADDVVELEIDGLGTQRQTFGQA